MELGAKKQTEDNNTSLGIQLVKTTMEEDNTQYAQGSTLLQRYTTWPGASCVARSSCMDPVSAQQTELRLYLERTGQFEDGKQRGGKASARGPINSARPAPDIVHFEVRSDQSGAQLVASSQATCVSQGGQLQPWQFEFGKYTKQPVVLLDEVLRVECGYVQWAMSSSIHHPCQHIAHSLLERCLISEMPVDNVGFGTAAPFSFGLPADGPSHVDVDQVRLSAATPRNNRGFGSTSVVVPYVCQQCGSSTPNLITCLGSTREQYPRLADIAAHNRL